MKTELALHERARTARVLTKAHQVGTKQGKLVIFTGDGKGKTTAAFGMGWRALCHGMKVGVVQFMGSDEASAEYRLLGTNRLCEFPILAHRINVDAPVETRQEVSLIWGMARTMLADSSYDMVILDDILPLIKWQYLDIDAVLAALRKRFPNQHIVLTGRKAAYELQDMADVVTEMRAIQRTTSEEVSQEGVSPLAGIHF